MSRRNLRIGVFGLLGTGNSGNEASLEAMLNYLRERHAEATLDAMSAGFRSVQAKYGLPATALSWYELREQAPGPAKIILKVAGKAIDPLRILFWVRKHDAVIVPGMGVLEHTLRLSAFGFPLSMFWLGVAGRACRVKVALVSVGASVIEDRGIRFLYSRAARMASYRSYRDAYSMQAMGDSGADTSADRIFPDLVFSYPVPAYDPGDPNLVGVGVMRYDGGHADPAKAEETYAAYVEKMTVFVRWLLETGYSVRFFGGDDTWDNAVADEITERVRRQCPAIDVAARVTAGPLESYAGLLTELNRAGTVIASRFHNVIGALKLCKPTIAVGYSHKFMPLMESAGMAEFTQFAGALDADLLIKQFEDLQDRRTEVVPGMAKVNAANAESLAEQFAILDNLLLGGAVR